MSLFRRNYQAERQFMRHNYIRLRGRTWFLTLYGLSLIHISEPTRRTPISYAVFCLKKKKISQKKKQS